MTAWVRVAGQLAILTGMFAAVAWLADWPRYHPIPPDSAVIKLSFAHGADRKAECRRRTPEELAAMPPNMRQPLACSRARGGIYVELDLDGRNIYQASLQPSGIASDGPARVYERFVVPAGPHTVAVRMRDTPRSDGFDHVKIGNISLAADQSFVIDFRSRGDGFEFH